MAFTRDSFARSSYHSNSNVPVTWNYKTNDTQADVNTAGYFNALSREVHVGDIIDAYVDADGTPALVRFYVNAATAGGTVDVVDGVAVTSTDSD